MSPLYIVLLIIMLSLTYARFGQENPPAIGKIRDCAQSPDGNINGQMANFAGSAIGTLLAAANECAQQNKADDIIDFAKANNLAPACIAAAVELRRAEKNVNPFAVANPCSKICASLPRNQELRGSVQAFDPACDSNKFFAENPDQLANFQLQTGNAGAAAAPALPATGAVAACKKATVAAQTVLTKKATVAAQTVPTKVAQKACATVAPVCRAA